MSAKKWLAAFLCIAVVIGLLAAGFNYLTDPFGVFDSPVLDWPSYEMTMNPRAAKITYLDKHHEKYDSYVIGCSSTSSFPVETLNKYFGASFYNLIMYGADMLDVEQTVNYLIENYTVKNLVLNVYIDNANSYNIQDNYLTEALLPRVSGANSLVHTARYLLSDPAFGMEKIKKSQADTWLQQSYDVFVAETGVYDKSKRDAEPIGGLERYLEAYPEFVNYPSHDRQLVVADQCVQSVGRIKAACERAGVSLTVVTAPIYHEFLQYFDRAQVTDFYTKLANTVDFWDFSHSSVSFEPRYFYDRTHFRNAIGDMALARIFGDGSLYIPDDFGKLVTAENVADHMASFFDVQPLAEEDYTLDIPVLLYHHLEDDAKGNATIVTPARFEEQLRAMVEAGYEAVSLDDIYAYVHEGAALPEKPYMITFDDGYASNYELAYPILEKYGQKATIFAVGVTFGCDTYKDTGAKIAPHFDAEAAREMVESGLIDVQSHTYDMHQVAEYDGENCRKGVLQLAGESEAAYIQALTDDMAKSRAVLERATGEAVRAIAYPYGMTSELTRTVLGQLGFDFTFTTEPVVNTLVKGMPQSLLGLGRFTITDDMTGDDVLALLQE